ncbi:Cytidylyltransferase family protein [Phycisphaerae bacterium RAS1]|nr:Cytidylyltransferase family protein [Phycisphaerae bacterium RAS1]
MNHGREIGRKVVHLTSALVPIVYLFAPRDRMLMLAGAALAIVLAVDWLRRTPTAFGRWFRGLFGYMLRSYEERELMGGTFVLLAGFLCVLLFSKPIAVTVLFILSISDSAASIIGILFGKARFMGKTIAGSAAFFVTALVIAAVLLPGRVGIIVVAAVAATLVEALPLRIGGWKVDDNLSVPLITGCVLTFCEALGW